MKTDPGRHRIPVSVLTGFLGSGKTTVLRHLARHGGLDRTLVLVNEFGEVGLDHQLLTRIDDDTLVALESGCICCTIRSDLARTLADAPGRYARNGTRWFDRVIIETTGLADPAPILQTILSEPTVAPRYALARVLTTVDAAHGLDTLARHPEALKQVGVCDRVLLTKTDLVDDAEVEQLRAALQTRAPSAPVTPIRDGAVEASWFFSGGPWLLEGKHPDVEGWLALEDLRSIDEHDHDHGDHDHAHDPNRHGRITASCLIFDDPVDAQALDRCLEALMLFRGADLLRMKGIVNVRGLDLPLVIHGVQHVVHPPELLEAWPGEDRRTRIVLITRDLDPELLRSCFARFGLEATPAPPAEAHAHG